MTGKRTIYAKDAIIKRRPYTPQKMMEIAKAFDELAIAYDKAGEHIEAGRCRKDAYWYRNNAG